MRVKDVIQGLHDYLKDCYHDKMIEDAEELGCVLYDTVTKKKNNPIHIVATTWKEGNLWHYIKQRQIGNEVKKQKRSKHV